MDSNTRFRKQAYALVDELNKSENEDLKRAFLLADSITMDFDQPAADDRYGQMYIKRFKPVFMLNPEQSNRWREILKQTIFDPSGAEYSVIVLLAKQILQ